MADPEPIEIEVVYALPQRQVIVELQVPPGASVADAVAASGLEQRFPQIVAGPLACAIHGRAVSLATSLRTGDRVEILRPLLIDPKESRRQAARAGKSMRREGKQQGG